MSALDGRVAPVGPRLPRWRARAIGVVALLVVVLGCSRGDGEPLDPAGAASSTTTSTTASEPAPDPTGGADRASGPAVTEEELALRGDGLGVVAFGASPAAAVDRLAAILGQPTADAGWEPAFSVYGTCPGEEIRAVSWDGLTVLFTDGETEHGSGEHLFSWRLTSAPPAVGTPEGLSVGATSADAEQVYGDAAELVPAEGPFPALVVLAAVGGEITGFLDDEGEVITNLEAGTSCGE